MFYKATLYWIAKNLKKKLIIKINYYCYSVKVAKLFNLSLGRVKIITFQE